MKVSGIKKNKRVREREKAYYVEVNCFKWKLDSHCGKEKALRKITPDYLD